MIDLHCHTTASDGSLSPEELVLHAKTLGLSALAVTDHDTIDGVPSALATGTRLGIDIVPGVEFSAEYSPGTMHILGLEIDPQHQPLNAILAGLRVDRNERNPKIAAALNKLGFEITMAEVEESAGGKVIGRPHFGKVMVAKGYVSSVDEAFEKYLNVGRPGYVEQARIAPSAAIKAITDAGGVAILAHPYQLRPTSDSHLEEIVRALVAAGLQGIEVYYSKHTTQQTAFYQQLALKYGLVQSGGSDFHGASKPQIQLGTGLGELVVPPHLLTEIRSRKIQLQNLAPR